MLLYFSFCLKNSNKTLLTKIDFPIPKGPEINIISLSLSSSCEELTKLFNSSKTFFISFSRPNINILGSIESLSIFPSKSNLGLSRRVLIRE